MPVQYTGSVCQYTENTAVSWRVPVYWQRGPVYWQRVLDLLPLYGSAFGVTAMFWCASLNHVPHLAQGRLHCQCCIRQLVLSTLLNLPCYGEDPLYGSR